MTVVSGSTDLRTIPNTTSAVVACRAGTALGEALKTSLVDFGVSAVGTRDRSLGTSWAVISRSTVLWRTCAIRIVTEGAWWALSTG